MAEKNQGVNKTPKSQNNDVIINVVTQDPVWISDEEKFQVPFVVTLSKGNWPLKNHSIIVIEEAGVITQNTNDNGVLCSYIEIPKKRAGQMVTLKFNIKGYNILKEIVISLPSIPEKKEPKEKKAVYFDVQSYVKYDEISITATVMDIEGNGVEGKMVCLVYRGKNNYLPATDKNGNTGTENPIKVEKGERLVVVVKVSNILNPEILTFEEPTFITDIDEDESKDTETKNTETTTSSEENKNLDNKKVVVKKLKPLSNNMRAFIFIVVMITLWIVCWNTGTGDSIINPPDTELSTAQIRYNQLAAMHNPSWVIKPEVSKGNWQKTLWIITFFFSIFTLIYTLFVAPSDEIKSIFIKWNKKRKIKTSGGAEDPLWERIMFSFLNSSEEIQSKRSKPFVPPQQAPPIDSNTASNPASTPAESKNSMWSMNSLKSNIIVQLILELIAEIAAHKFISNKIK